MALDAMEDVKLLSLNLQIDNPIHTNTFNWEYL
jgi:hypothetical protein